jgi:hypothetical protein
MTHLKSNRRTSHPFLEAPQALLAQIFEPPQPKLLCSQQQLVREGGVEFEGLSSCLVLEIQQHPAAVEVIVSKRAAAVDAC